MKNLKSLLILCFTVLLSACGTINDGQTQSVRLETPGAQEAKCTLDNGVRYTADTGMTLEIMRSRNDLKLDCYASGNRHKEIVVKSLINDWALADATTGILPGVAVDHVYGGLYAYPEVITVDFVGMPTPGFELPNYHYNDAPNPYKQSIEDFGPKVPKVDADRSSPSYELKKRDTSVSVNPFASTAKVSDGGDESSQAASASTASVQKSSPSPVISGKNAEDLTRSMNPHVFGK